MINKLTLIGRVGTKENKETRNGGVLTSLSVATTRHWKDKEGNKQEETTWHLVNYFNKLADIANSYVHVGDLIYVEGTVSNRKVTDNQGNDKWLYSVTGDKLTMLPSNNKNKPDSGLNQSASPNKFQQPVQDFGDDIPF
jgi:single-strand DNA-binding protein